MPNPFNYEPKERPVPDGYYQLKPCPFCGNTPDANDPASFIETSMKWGAVQCCFTGPEVRTKYQSLEHWKPAAIAAWNKRVESL